MSLAKSLLVSLCVTLAVPATGFSEAAPAAATALPALRAPMESGLVVRVKKLREFLQSASLPEDFPAMMGLKELTTPLEDAPSAPVVTVVRARTVQGDDTGAFHLYSFASPCPMEQFLGWTGVRTPPPGDDNLRTRINDIGGLYSRSDWQKVGPGEFFESSIWGRSHSPKGVPAQLAGLRAEVARAGFLVWKAEPVLDLGALTAIPDSRLEDAVFTVEAPGDLIVRGSGRPTGKADAPALASALGPVLEGLPFWKRLPENLRPALQVTAGNGRVEATLVFKKETLTQSLTTLAGAIRSSEFESRSLGDAKSAVRLWQLKQQQQPGQLIGVSTVEAALTALGSRDGRNARVESLLNISLQLFSTDPEYLRLVSRCLTLQDGQLTLSPAGRKLEAAREAKEAALPDDHPVVATKAKRNAMNLAAQFAAAVAAGSEALPKVRTVEEAVSLLNNGVTGSGQFHASVFRVADLSKTDRRRALAYLKLNGTSEKTLDYTGAE